MNVKQSTTNKAKQGAPRRRRTKQPVLASVWVFLQLLTLCCGGWQTLGRKTNFEAPMTQSQMKSMFNQWTQQFVAEFTTQFQSLGAESVPPMPSPPQGANMMQQIEYAKLLQQEYERQQWQHNQSMRLIQDHSGDLEIDPLPHSRGTDSGSTLDRQLYSGREASHPADHGTTNGFPAELPAEPAGHSHPYLSMIQRSPRSPRTNKKQNRNGRCKLLSK
jgi:hypothetical protein